MKSRTLELSTLIELDACKDQVNLFREKFGCSVEVTPELCVGVAAEFSWDWAAQNLLSAQALAEGYLS